MLFYTENALKFAFSKDRMEFGANYSKANSSKTNSPNKVLNSNEPVFGMLGVPFDSTSTYKPGARFGPNFLREASYNLERYNLSLNKNLETTFYDLGNLEVVHGNFQKTCNHLKSTIKELIDLHIIPVVMGGEHSLSYGVIQALDIKNTTILHLDAHLDLREEYMGEKFSHATVMKRIFELNPQKVIQIGVRSCSQAEAEYAQNPDITYYTSHEVRRNVDKIRKVISDLKGPIYVTVDMDVLDPAFAPSVGNPVPDGLHPHHLKNLLSGLEGKEIRGLDLMEISATHIGDITSINGAQVLYDFLCLQ